MFALILIIVFLEVSWDKRKSEEGTGKQLSG